jgi:hypothetical protein
MASSCQFRMSPATGFAAIPFAAWMRRWIPRWRTIGGARRSAGGGVRRGYRERGDPDAGSVAGPNDPFLRRCARLLSPAPGDPNRGNPIISPLAIRRLDPRHRTDAGWRGQTMRVLSGRALAHRVESRREASVRKYGIAGGIRFVSSASDGAQTRRTAMSRSAWDVEGAVEESSLANG